MRLIDADDFIKRFRYGEADYMAKAMGVSPITDTIYYGNLKNDKWVGKKEDVTKMAIKAVFEWFMHKHEQNCPDGEYQIRFPGIPYVLTMKKEEKGGTDAEH